MANNNYKPLQTGYTRVFLIAGRARPDHTPEYYSSLKMSGVSQAFGDVTKIEIPDPNNFGKFIEVDRIRGAVERATFSLIGRYAAAIKSRLIELANQGCAADVQLNMGECTDPSNANVFTKKLINEDCLTTNHSTDDLGALESGEAAQINETSEMSATTYYEVLPLSYVARADNVVTTQVNDVVLVDSASCGSCATESDGCQLYFAVTEKAGGSAGTMPDILWTPNGGATWYAQDIDTLTTAQDADSVAGVGDYVVAVSGDVIGLNYALIQDFKDGIDAAFTQVTTGFVATKFPKHIFSIGRKAFIVGIGGYVYFTEDPTAGVTVLDAGAATISTLNFVHAFDENHAVAVGNNGVVIFTTNRTSWGVAPTSPVGFGGTLTSVFMKSATEWWVTSLAGGVYYTLNSGKSWTQKTMPGTTPTEMDHIIGAGSSIMYASGIVASHGRIYRSFDGGYSWVVEPKSGSMPLSDKFLRLACCKYNVNTVVAVGLGDNGTDGVIVTGDD
jgi:hypothetical protein